jgi:hypothetical protein
MMTIRAWREEAGGARRVLEGSREEEMEALRQSGFEQRRTRWRCVGQRLHGAALSLSLSLSLSLLYFKCEGSV